MSRTSHSPRRVMQVAYQLGRSALPDYTHRFSPHRFTQPQLLACLVLKTFLKLDYRRTEALLADSRDLRETIHLQHTPDHTTLARAARRLLSQPRVRRLLEQSVSATHRIDLAAIDSTGFEAGQVSPYFVKRRSRGQKGLKNPLYETTTYTRFPKLHAVCDCHSHLIISVFATRGPTPDVHQLTRVIQHRSRHRVMRLLADAGYDSEANHVYLREQLDIESIIPPKHGRRPKDPNHLPPTTYRRLMKQQFDHAAYGQRWQIETVFSMIKRRLGSAIREKTYHAQCRAMRLLALTHNCMILLRYNSFATEQNWLHSDSSRTIHLATLLALWSPITLISFWELSLEAADLWILALAPVQVALGAAIGVALGKAMKLNRSHIGVMAIGAGMANQGFTCGAYLCYCLLEPRSNAMAYGIAFVTVTQIAMIPILYPIARHFGPHRSEDDTLFDLFWKSFIDIRAMPLYAAVGGVALALCNAPSPQFIWEWHIFDVMIYLGALGAMYGIGMRLYLRGSLHYVREHMILAFVRFMIIPLFIFIALQLLALTPWNVSPLLRDVLVVESFAPTALMLVILANLFHLDTRMAGGAWLWNTILFLIGPLPFLVWWF